MQSSAQQLPRRDVLRSQVGSMRQLCGIRHVTFMDGMERGVEALEFHLGSGFVFTAVPSRAMDIAFAEYRDQSLVWLSPTGVVHPQYYDPKEWGWLKGFFGGLLTTCGLVNVGPPEIVDGEQIGGHGRITYIPAERLECREYWNADGYWLEATGEMHEVRINKTNLLLNRTIRAMAGERRLFLTDVVRNDGPRSQVHRILYHINAGYPLLDLSSRLILPVRTVTPRDPEANKGKRQFNVFGPPQAAYQEKCYFHELVPLEDGRVGAAVVNERLSEGRGLYAKWSKAELPCMVQWKMLGVGAYVNGIEPANCLGLGMEKERELGTLVVLEPGEARIYRLEIGVLSGRREIRRFEQAVKKVAPAQPKFRQPVIFEKSKF